MKLKVIGTGSSGNCYLLQPSKGKGLLLECGLTFDKIKQGLDFNLDLEACLVTHEHKDHCFAAQQIIDSGIPLYTSFGTAAALKLNNPHCLISGDLIELGDWKFKAFRVNHDVVEPFGYMIAHPECGTIVFITDTSMINYEFTGINHWIIEANYSNDIMLNKLMGENIQPYLAGRICQNHLSIEETIQILKANYETCMRSVTLIHLSESNAWPDKFSDKVAGELGIRPNIASNGKTFDL